MNEKQWMVLGGAVIVLCLIVGVVNLSRSDRGGFWAAVVAPAGLTWCLYTGLDGEYTDWQPDLWGIPHGWGYAAGLGLAAFAFIGGALHR